MTNANDHLYPQERGRHVGAGYNLDSYPFLDQYNAASGGNTIADIQRANTLRETGAVGPEISGASFNAERNGLRTQYLNGQISYQALQQALRSLYIEYRSAGIIGQMSSVPGGVQAEADSWSTTLAEASRRVLADREAARQRQIDMGTGDSGGNGDNGVTPPRSYEVSSQPHTGTRTAERLRQAALLADFDPTREFYATRFGGQPNVPAFLRPALERQAGSTYERYLANVLGRGAIPDPEALGTTWAQYLQDDPQFNPGQARERLRNISGFFGLTPEERRADPGALFAYDVFGGAAGTSAEEARNRQVNLIMGSVGQSIAPSLRGSYANFLSRYAKDLQREDPSLHFLPQAQERGLF
jgi:hypothetical protein